ncbi:MAG: hypothetical protein HQM16_18660 [Deltaproteobacteria bacterium]|nr:hypothetical protein [Deltaproteobacteria bacterium]
MIKNILCMALFVVFLCSCVEGGGGGADATLAPNIAVGASEVSTDLDSGPDAATISEINTAPAQASLKDDYNQSGFSQYVYFHKDEGRILIDHNFFPSGSNLCHKATYDEKTNPNGCKRDFSIAIPCEYRALAGDELLAVNVSASTEDTACKEDIIIDLSTAEFTVEGLVFTETPPLETFADEFEFAISKDGFVDTHDNTPLGFETKDIGLEDVYDKIMEKRTE